MWHPDVVACRGGAVIRNEREAHDLLRATDWPRMRAGFTVQGPYRRGRRVMRWLLAFAAMAALIALKVMA